ncbi:putative amidase C869.01 [Vitis vinifera]|uniref:Putative amidase C869.01 n=1 Tax=Vitis vinifera TaxID=29760 RepID=A0A438DSW2_VITVI|nr:putative amidase C869.01 [Vitis vinifera]
MVRFYLGEMHKTRPNSSWGNRGVVRKLRKVGAIILGKACLSEWAGSRFATPYGWCARAGQGRNPYVLSETPCGSSSGSAISVAANLAAVSLGTETDGSILYPSHINSVVGIKPMPICRTVSDAVEVLDVIVGFEKRDEATRTASKYIPLYAISQCQWASSRGRDWDRQGGAILVDHLEIANIDVIFGSSREEATVEAEFKISLNAYLKELVASPIQIKIVKITFWKDDQFSWATSGENQRIWTRQLSASRSHKRNKQETLLKLARLSRNGFKKLMNEHKLDALVTPGADVLEDSPELLFQLDMIAKECHLAFV